MKTKQMHFISIGLEDGNLTSRQLDEITELFRKIAEETPGVPKIDSTTWETHNVLVD